MHSLLSVICVVSAPLYALICVVLCALIVPLLAVMCGVSALLCALIRVIYSPFHAPLYNFTAAVGCTFL